MLTWLKELDRILRGESTRVSAMRDGSIRFPVYGVAAVVVTLGLVYGACMGSFALINRPVAELRQLLATTLKVPALFFLTLLVTTPSLYVFNALVGSRLSVSSLLRLLIAALAVTLAVLASFGPITIFFSITTDNYSFMVLLNVVLFSVAGVLGLVFLLQTLHRLSLALGEQARRERFADPYRGQPDPAGDGGSADSSAELSGALEPIEGTVLGPHVRSVFRAWVLIFALVGAQMSWVLRPFIGNPTQPFQWFRPRTSNFFEAVWHTLESLVR